MADANAALIAFLGVLAGGYVNNFLAEDYRRFRDGTALAGALAGELASHMLAFPFLKAMLTAQISAIRNGQSPAFRHFDPPNDPIYESGVSKLGLVGSGLAEDVAFAYQQIRAFRLNYALVLSQHEAMGNPEIIARLEGCLATIVRGEERANKLLADLRTLAGQRYLETRSQWIRTKAANIN
jgi:hypothetical protein